MDAFIGEVCSGTVFHHLNIKRFVQAIVSRLCCHDPFHSKHDGVVPHFTSVMRPLRHRFPIDAIVADPDVEPRERMWKRT
jgi:hypothetical protein